MSIRTTVTLDEDVLERSKEFSRKRGIPFREALNDLLRAGLRAESAAQPRRAFKVKPKRMGLMPGLNYDNIEAVLEIAEGVRHR
jgi:metal-responsive CopG/Arc/MetJ family transcriptional regulator